MANTNQKNQKILSKIGFMAILAATTTSFLLPVYSTADSQTKQIITTCRQYAEEDKISGIELDSYLQQCVRDIRDAQENEGNGFTIIPIQPETPKTGSSNQSTPPKETKSQ